MANKAQLERSFAKLGKILDRVLSKRAGAATDLEILEKQCVAADAAIRKALAFVRESLPTVSVTIHVLMCGEIRHIKTSVPLVHEGKDTLVGDLLVNFYKRYRAITPGTVALFSHTQARVPLTSTVRSLGEHRQLYAAPIMGAEWHLPAFKVHLRSGHTTLRAMRGQTVDAVIASLRPRKGVTVVGLSDDADNSQICLAPTTDLYAYLSDHPTAQLSLVQRKAAPPSSADCKPAAVAPPAAGAASAAAGATPAVTLPGWITTTPTGLPLPAALWVPPLSASAVVGAAATATVAAPK